MPGKWIWRHDGTAWVQVWSADTTPPAAPGVSLAIVSGTKNVVSVTLTTPPAPIIRTVVKVGVNKWPSSSPTDTSDGCYYAQTSPPNGVGVAEPWSEWWYQYPSSTYGASGITGTKWIPSSYQTFTFPLSTPIMVSAWCQDDFFNWSAAGSSYIYTLNPDPPPPTLKYMSQYFGAVDSASWMTAGPYANQWDSNTLSNHYVYQAGSYGQNGYWFYGAAPQQAMASRNAATKLNIYIQRVNTAHGVSGGANVHVGAHTMWSRPGGAPSSIMGIFSPGTLLRGEGKWFDLTAPFPGGTWAEQFAAGGLKGFGLGYGVTAFTDPNYLYAYGAGTSGGQLYCEWNQY